MKTNKLYLSVIIGIILLSMISLTSAKLEPVKQNEIAIIKVLSNCSSVNITEITSGNNINILNAPMTYIGGQTFMYNFTGTYKIGEYTYSWDDPCIDCSIDNCGNSFEVTPSGFITTLGFYVILLIIIGSIIGLGFVMKDYWFVVAGGMACMLLGIYSINYGIAGQKDMFMTWGMGLFEIFLGGYLAIKAGLEAAED